MKRIILLNLICLLIGSGTARAQNADCAQLLHDYQVYKNRNQISEMAGVVQQGMANHCSSIEYEIAKNHRNNNNFDKYVEYLNIAADDGETAAKCDLLTLYEAGTITKAPAITKEACQGQVSGKTEDISAELYFEHPVWSDEERRRIWEENYSTSFSSFDAPFDYNKVDFERIDKAWRNTKIGLALILSGTCLTLTGLGISFADHDAMFYTGMGIIGLSGAVMITAAPFLASHNRLLRQGGVKFRTDGVVVTYNGVGIAYTQRFPYRPGYEVRRGHYVKIKQKPLNTMITPTFSKDYKGLSLVATW